MVSEKNSFPSVRNHLIQGAFGSFFLKISQTVFNVLLTIILTNLMTLESFGIYAFCLSIINLLTIPAMMGGQQLLIREIPAYQTKHHFPSLRGLLRRTRLISFLSSVLIAVFAWGLGWLIYRNKPMHIPFEIAISLVPLVSFKNLTDAALRGFRHIILGQLSMSALPCLVIISVCCIHWWFGMHLSSATVLTVQTICTAILSIGFYVWLVQLLPKEVKHSRPEYETRRWLNSMLPFVFTGGMLIVNREASVVLLGILEGKEAVALYRIAQRGAELVPFGLMAVNMAIAPTVSELLSRNEKKRLQQMINKSMLAILAFTIPVSSILILFGSWLIPFVFGKAYAPAYMPMVILCIGQLVNVCVGSVGVVLNMAGLEKIAARGATIASLLCVSINLLLIPIWGANGAAIGTSSSMTVLNVLLTIWLYKHTGILCTFRFSRRYWRKTDSK